MEVLVNGVISVNVHRIVAMENKQENDHAPILHLLMVEKTAKEA